MLTDEEIQEIKRNCEAWGHYCGGCETCGQVFGKVPEYDFRETYQLILKIEELQAKLKEAEGKS